MAISVVQLSTKELQNLIDNHRKKSATKAALYLEALEEMASRRGRGLNFPKTLEIIRSAARHGKFLSYKDLADESGVKWDQARYAINEHLGELVEYGHHHKWPMLSAIAVNKPNVESGEMEPDTLKGFIRKAKELGYAITDERAFLREQQAAVFEWARASVVEE